MTNCENCRFWDQYNTEIGVGWCQRHAPRPHEVRDPGGVLLSPEKPFDVFWPSTSTDDFCGEGEREPWLDRLRFRFWWWFRGRWKWKVL